jgi:hypothetical protein
MEAGMKLVELDHNQLEQVCGGIAHELGEFFGNAYAWYEANIMAIHAGNLAKSRP